MSFKNQFFLKEWWVLYQCLNDFALVKVVNQLWWFCVCCINQCPRSPYQNKKLIVQTKEGETRVQEKSRVLDEKCHLKTVEFVDEVTGQVSLRTVQVIEKTIEHEVARCPVCVCPSMI